jgi:hypothetical protein
MQRWVCAAVVFGVLAAGLPGTGRADYWKYTKDNGNVGFADELKQVPARYRQQAVRQADQPLAQYPRYTGVAPGRAAAAPRTAAAALQGAEPAADETASAQGSMLLIEPAPEVLVPVLEDAEQPLRVDRHVLRWENGRYRSFTIVRRGERVISEIEER